MWTLARMRTECHHVLSQNEPGSICMHENRKQSAHFRKQSAQFRKQSGHHRTLSAHFWRMPHVSNKPKPAMIESSAHTYWNTCEWCLGYWSNPSISLPEFRWNNFLERRQTTVSPHPLSGYTNVYKENQRSVLRRQSRDTNRNIKRSVYCQYG